MQLLANNNAAGGGRRRRRDLGPGCREEDEEVVRRGHRAAATIVQGLVNAVDDQGELQTCNRCLTMGWRVQYTRSHIWFPGLDVVQGSHYPGRLLGHRGEDKLLLQLGTFGERFRRLLVLLLRIGERALDRWVEGARRS